MEWNGLENRTERNYGIDLLRLVSMLGVVIFHIFTHGGALDSASGATLGAANLLMTLVCPAVNCYAIISGFVGYSEEEKPYRYARYLTYWVQAAFYCVAAALIFYLLGANGMRLKDVAQAALPVTFARYWYFTAYSVLFFLIPWLNRFVRKLTSAEMTRFVLVIFAIFSLFACLVRGSDDHLSLRGG